MEKQQAPKMRIVFRNCDGGLVSDRLVTQNLELSTGATEQHDGPITLEATFRDQSDAEGLINYIKQLTGKLPLSQKRTYTPTNNRNPMNDSYYMKFLTELSRVKNQELLIDELRKMGYFFYTMDHLRDLGVPIILKENHEKYQFMVRRIKEAKDPANDKLDTNLIFGIKILGKHFDKVQIYYRKPESQSVDITYQSTMKLTWPENTKMNFKKVVASWKFPNYMSFDERRKWRQEHAKLERNPALKPTKFYLRHKPDVQAI
jgi:hypothetical protein